MAKLVKVISKLQNCCKKFGGFKKKPYICRRNTKQHHNMSMNVEVLEFRNKAAEVATAVTDGRNVRTYEPSRCTSHKTLHAAIAYLEVKNYQIYIGI